MSFESALRRAPLLLSAVLTSLTLGASAPAGEPKASPTAATPAKAAQPATTADPALAALEKLRLSIQRVKLDNGLTVILDEDSSSPTVAVNVTYKVGSRNEQVGRSGFA